MLQTNLGLIICLPIHFSVLYDNTGAIILLPEIVFRKKPNNIHYAQNLKKIIRPNRIELQLTKYNAHTVLLNK